MKANMRKNRRGRTMETGMRVQLTAVVIEAGTEPGVEVATGAVSAIEVVIEAERKIETKLMIVPGERRENPGAVTREASLISLLFMVGMSISLIAAKKTGGSILTDRHS
jgi:hypothetical protein